MMTCINSNKAMVKPNLSSDKLGQMVKHLEAIFAHEFILSPLGFHLNMKYY